MSRAENLRIARVESPNRELAAAATVESGVSMAGSCALVVVLLCCAVGHAAALAPLPPHPRLILNATHLQNAKDSVAHDSVAKALWEATQLQAEQILPLKPVTQPPSTYVGILTTVREALGRIVTLAFVHVYQSDSLTSTTPSKFSVRATQELVALANFTTWNPPHFLDVGEATYAAAIGYDWLYYVLSPDDRAFIAAAINKYGLVEGVKVYNGTDHTNGWWADSPINWNQVCNGGLAVGALAIGDLPSYSDAADAVFTGAVQHLPISVAEWSPHGVWPEGSGYTEYAAKYLTQFLAATETALGGDPSSLSLAGVEDIGMWVVNSVGPSGYYNNWADCSPKPTMNTAANMFFLASRYDNATFAYAARSIMNSTDLNDLWGSAALALLHWDSSGSFVDVQSQPRDTVWPSRYVGFFRDEWTDVPSLGQPHGNATWLAYKGGNMAWTHGHLDAGAFVFESMGNRWAWDLGAGWYGLPDYFGDKRWEYYRTNSSGHNVLTLDAKNFNATAVVPITAFASNSTARFSVLNMTDAYSESSATNMYRGFAMLEVNGVNQTLIVDELGKSSAQVATWAMHTTANIIVKDSKDRAYLIGTSALLVKLVDASMCPGAVISVVNVTLTSPQKPLLGMRKLVVSAPAQTCTRLSIVLSDDYVSAGQGFSVNPVQAWATQGPIVVETVDGGRV